MKSIVNNTDCETLQQIQEIEIILNSSLLLLLYYYAYLNPKSYNWMSCRPAQINSVKKYFHKVLQMLIPAQNKMIIETVMHFLESRHLWRKEFITSEILTSVLSCKVSPSDLLSEIFKFLDRVLQKNDIEEARHVIRVLYTILNNEIWSGRGLSDINNLIFMYRSSFDISDSKYNNLRQGLNMCLKRFFDVIANAELTNIITTMLKLVFGTNLSEDLITEYGSAIEYAALCRKTDLITESLEPQLFEYLLNIVASDESPVSELACKILSRLLDRHDNFQQFVTPKIFFQNFFYDVRISNYESMEKKLIQTYQKQIDAAIFSAIIKHSHNSKNLESIFILLCLISVEVPCGFTASVIIWILVRIQTYALNDSDLDMSHTNRIHSMILSVLTLLCWIHRTKSLTEYVQLIVNRRCDKAPHLNPPFQDAYQYAHHHITWNTSEIFFEPLELRYGLWKRFRCQEKRLPKKKTNETKRKSN